MIKLQSYIVSLIAILLVSCSSVRSEFYIHNKSGLAVSNVTVADGQRKWSLGEIPAGGKIEFSGAFSGEGGPSISWNFKGKRFSDKGCYYTQGMPSRGSISIVGPKLEFKCQ